MKTILVVDDEPKIAALARDYLEHAGFAVVSATDGPGAIAAIGRSAPDLVVLDLGLPGLDGLEVTRHVRRDSSLPIVMLTARDDEIDKLLGLELGADDYLTKPFSPRELVARVKAVLRRVDAGREPRSGAGDTIRAADLTLDIPRMRIDVGGRLVDLTPTEFQLLATMAAQPGRIFTRSQLLDAVHGVAFESYERAIDTHVKNIRRKIEPDPTLASLPPDRLWRRLPVRGRPIVSGGSAPDPSRDRPSADRPAHRRPGRPGRRGRPPWWPADEPWPPADRRGPWMGRRGPWRRGFGCLFGLAFLLALVGLFGFVASVVAAVGPLGDLARVLAVCPRDRRDRRRDDGRPDLPAGCRVAR